MAALAVDLADRGWATWNVEYRRVGNGGGVPETLDDVRAAIAALTQLAEPLDTGRVVIVGHSAGGQLGLCVADEPAVAGGGVAGRRMRSASRLRATPSASPPPGVHGRRAR